MLDINLFREERGGKPELIRESLRRRFKDVGIVDEIIQLDREWRQGQFEVENLKKESNKISKEIAKLSIAKKDASEKKAETIVNKRLTAEKEVDVQKAKAELDAKLATVGNLVHDSVPESDNEGIFEGGVRWLCFVELFFPCHF